MDLHQIAIISVHVFPFCSFWIHMLFANKRQPKTTPRIFLCPDAAYFHYPSALAFFSSFPSIWLQCFPLHSIHLLHCSFIHPGNRNRLQQCWYYDRVRALHWSLGLYQECCVSRPAATSSIHGLPLRICTAGKTRITGLKNYIWLYNSKNVVFNVFRVVFNCVHCYRETQQLCF